MYFVIQPGEDGRQIHQATTKDALWDLIFGERDDETGERDGGLLCFDAHPTFSRSIVTEISPAAYLTIIKGEIVVPTPVQIVTGWDIE